MAENGVRFLPGNWNAICDVCAQKYKAGEMRKRWDGLMVCPNDWEPRHPQDFLRAVPDRQAVPWNRPQTPDVFVPFDWDKYISENIGVQDVISTVATYNRYIPFMDVLQTQPPTQRPLDSQVLNWGVLGGADSAQPLTQETIHNSESLVLSFTKRLTDTATMSETLQAIAATALNDSTHPTEYLSVTFLFKQAPLDGNAFNGGPL